MAAAAAAAGAYGIVEAEAETAAADSVAAAAAAAADYLASLGPWVGSAVSAELEMFQGLVCHAAAAAVAAAAAGAAAASVSMVVRKCVVFCEMCFLGSVHVWKGWRYGIACCMFFGL